MEETLKDLSRRFVDSAKAFAADLVKPIVPCDAQESRMVKRTRLRHDFVEAYRAMEGIEHQEQE